mgnify:CR=1 FL=1
MNLLYDALPDTVTVDGKAYRIYTDYRDWLRFYDMQEDDGLSTVSYTHLTLPTNREV